MSAMCGGAHQGQERASNVSGVTGSLSIISYPEGTGIEPESSKRAASVPHHRALSPAPSLTLLMFKYLCLKARPGVDYSASLLTHETFDKLLNFS